MNKGSDINVGSIEEAIEILRNAIRCNEKQFEELGTHILLQDDEQEAIKIVLGNLEALCDMQRSSDRELENARKINEEHQKINGELRKKVKELDTKNDELLKDLYSANCIIADLIDSIPKQKIKDKIKELDKRIDYIKTELTKLYIENETIGTETEMDNNEYYIYNLEKEQELKCSQKNILQKLLRESEGNNANKV